MFNYHPILSHYLLVPQFSNEYKVLTLIKLPSRLETYLEVTENKIAVIDFHFTIESDNKNHSLINFDQIGRLINSLNSNKNISFSLVRKSVVFSENECINSPFCALFLFFMSLENHSLINSFLKESVQKGELLFSDSLELSNFSSLMTSKIDKLVKLKDKRII